MCQDHATPNAFRGNDRRLLEMLRKCIRLIRRRDEIATTGRRTSRISTRDLVIDPNIAGLHAAFVAIDERACDLLGCDDFVPF